MVESVQTFRTATLAHVRPATKQTIVHAILTNALRQRARTTLHVSISLQTTRAIVSLATKVDTAKAKSTNAFPRRATMVASATISSPRFRASALKNMQARSVTYCGR